MLITRHEYKVVPDEPHFVLSRLQRSAILQTSALELRFYAPRWLLPGKDETNLPCMLAFIVGQRAAAETLSFAFIF